MRCEWWAARSIKSAESRDEGLDEDGLSLRCLRVRRVRIR